LTIVLIPLTFSITQGILWGIVSHVGLFLLSGRKKEISGTLYVLCGVALLLIFLD
jgi:AGZA family xanthine/uracil permease-like MFS transporter